MDPLKISQARIKREGVCFLLWWVWHVARGDGHFFTFTVFAIYFISISYYTPVFSPGLDPYSFSSTLTDKFYHHLCHPNGRVKRFIIITTDIITVSRFPPKKPIFWQDQKVLQGNYKIIACLTYDLVSNLLDHLLEDGEEKERRMWQLV